MVTRSAAEVTTGERPGMETIEDKRKLACGPVFLDYGDAFMSICWSNVLNQHFKYGHYSVSIKLCANQKVPPLSPVRYVHVLGSLVVDQVDQ